MIASLPPISFKSFLIGLGLVLIGYAGLFAYLAMNAQSTQLLLEARLATQTVLVDRPLVEAASAVPVSEVSSDADTIIETSQSEAIETDEPTLQDAIREEINGENGDEESLEDIVGKQAKSLRKAPIKGFYEDSAFGKLPIAKSPLQTPFEVYKRPYILNLAKPFIALGVEDFGLSRELSQEALDALPSNVSLLLSPYASTPENWVKKAREDGHEIWLNIPVERKIFPLDDPGAKGLLTRVSLQYNQERLKWLLGRATGYAGIAAYTDPALENAGPMFANIAKDMFERGLGFFELNPSNDSFFRPIAVSEDIPHIQSFGSIEVVDPQNERVKALLNAVKTNGGVIATVQLTPRNIQSLSKWIEAQEKRGIAIIPLSAIANPDIERN